MCVKKREDMETEGELCAKGQLCAVSYLLRSYKYSGSQIFGFAWQASLIYGAILSIQYAGFQVRNR